MADEPELNDELAELANVLSKLVPHKTQINRDRVMYEAGRAAERQGTARTRVSVRNWKIMAGTSIVAASSLAVMLIWQQLADLASESPRPKIVQAELVPKNLIREPERSPAMPSVSDRASDSSYLAVRNHTLAVGIENIPQRRTFRGRHEVATKSYGDLLNEILAETAYGG